MSASSERRTHIRKLGGTLTKRPTVAAGVVRQGVVTGVNADGTVSLTLGGSATVITSVRCLGHVSPFAGMTAWVLEFGGPSSADCLVVGVQDPTSKGWVTATTDFTLAAQWSSAVVQWRIAWPWASLSVMATRSSTAITGDAVGNITNTTIFSAIPTALVPQQTQGLAGPYEDGTGARGAWGCVTAAGTIRLTAVGGSTNVASEPIQLGGTYLLG